MYSFLQWGRAVDAAVRFRIVELVLGRRDKVVRRNILPQAIYANRRMAERRAVSLVECFDENGYEAAGDVWWAQDGHGRNYRFIVEAVPKMP
jgi:hypothetical protein